MDVVNLPPLMLMGQCCQVIIKQLAESPPSCMKSPAASDMTRHVRCLTTIARVCLTCQRNFDLSHLLERILSHLFRCHGQLEDVKIFCAEITSSRLLHCRGMWFSVLYCSLLTHYADFWSVFLNPNFLFQGLRQLENTKGIYNASVCVYIVVITGSMDVSCC